MKYENAGLGKQTGADVYGRAYAREIAGPPIYKVVIMPGGVRPDMCPDYASLMNGILTASPPERAMTPA
ncbi:MAG: hypothetical protein ACK4Y9_01520 [Hyphomonas sp.]